MTERIEAFGWFEPHGELRRKTSVCWSSCSDFWILGLGGFPTLEPFNTLEKT